MWSLQFSQLLPFLRPSKVGIWSLWSIVICRHFISVKKHSKLCAKFKYWIRSAFVYNEHFPFSTVNFVLACKVHWIYSHGKCAIYISDIIIIINDNNNIIIKIFPLLIACVSFTNLYCFCFLQFNLVSLFSLCPYVIKQSKYNTSFFLV